MGTSLEQRSSEASQLPKQIDGLQNSGLPMSSLLNPDTPNCGIIADTVCPEGRTYREETNMLESTDVHRSKEGCIMSDDDSDEMRESDDDISSLREEECGTARDRARVHTRPSLRRARGRPYDTECASVHV